MQKVNLNKNDIVVKPMSPKAFIRFCTYYDLGELLESCNVEMEHIFCAKTNTRPPNGHFSTGNMVTLGLVSIKRIHSQKFRIQNLYTLPSFRNNGVATALLNYVRGVLTHLGGTYEAYATDKSKSIFKSFMDEKQTYTHFKSYEEYN